MEVNDTAWAIPGGAYRAAARVRALIDRERARLAAQGHGAAVPAALGFAPAETRRALRCSTGPETSDADWRALLAVVVAVRDEVGAGGGVV